MPDDSYLKLKIQDQLMNKKEKADSANIFSKTDFEYKQISAWLPEYRYLNKHLQHYVTFAMQPLTVPIYKVECSEKINHLQGKSRVVYYFCESFHIGQECNLKASNRQVDSRNSASFKDKFKTEELIKTYDVTLTYRRYFEEEHKYSPNNPYMKKREVRSLDAAI